MRERAFGRQDSYVPLGEHAPHVAADKAGAVDRALSFDADERHAEIAGLRDALRWVDDTNPPTFIVPGGRDAEPAPRRSMLPWLLPLVGIAAIGIAAAYVNGLIALPKFETEIVKAPEPPKLEDMKEIPQAPVHTPSEANVPKQAEADGYMVVVASHKTEPEAEAALAKLKEQLPALFADQHAEVIGLDLGDAGTIYRAMVGPLTKEDADVLCQEFKRNSVACLVRMDQ